MSKHCLLDLVIKPGRRVSYDIVNRETVYWESIPSDSPLHSALFFGARSIGRPCTVPLDKSGTQEKHNLESQDPQLKNG